MSHTSSILPDPWPDVRGHTTQVYGRLDPQVHHYFFRSTLVGAHGSGRILVNTFFDKLHDACIAVGIPDVYGPDSERAVAEVVARLNFDAKPKRRKK